MAMDAQRLRRAIVIYAAVAMAVISLVVAVAGIAPLALRLRGAAVASLRHALELRAMAAADFIAHAVDLGRQVASRTMIRNALAAYNRGEIDRAALNATNKSRLTDAVTQSPDLLGAVELDLSGHRAMRAGRSFDWRRAAIPPIGSTRPIVSPPWRQGGSYVVTVSAPIVDDDGHRVGTVIVLVRAARLLGILRDAHAPDKNGDVALVVQANGEARMAIPFAAHAAPLTADAGDLIERCLRRHAGATVRSGSMVLAAAPLPGLHWVLLKRISAARATSDVDREILAVAGGAILLTILAIIGLVMVLRPLTGGFLVRATEMERQIEALTRAQRDLGEKSRQLERINAELQEYAYAASHDLQEPLRAVAGFAQLLSRRYGDRLDGEGAEFLGFIVEGAERMHRQINDLLDYARMGADAAIWEPVDLDSLLDEVMITLREPIADSGAVIERRKLPAAAGNRDRLARLLQNLVANAVKFTKPGETPRIDIFGHRNGDQVEIVVRDHGIGIDPQYQDRLFHMFKRLHPHGSYEGSGIGLAMCRKVAEDHGGRIWVESQAGEGAAFHVILPAAGAPPPWETRTGAAPTGSDDQAPSR